MTFLASDIVTRVRTQLVDTGSTARWSDPELMGWLSDAERTIVALQPAAANLIAVMPLISGSRQTIPANGYMLLDVIRNVDATGLVPGRTVRVVSKETLDTLDSSWTAETAMVVVQNYVYDPASAKVFMVYPPNTGAGYVEINYALAPPDVTALTQTLVVDDIYRTPCFDYVMFRAHQKDTDFGGGQNAAKMYLDTFMSFMGAQPPTQLEISPNNQLGTASLRTRGSAK